MQTEKINLPLLEIKSILERNIRSADSFVDIKIILTNGTIPHSCEKRYYEGKSDAYKAVLGLLGNYLQ